MASSSHYHYHKDDEDDLDTVFDDSFESEDLVPEPKERKNVFLLRETEKKATRSCGMIILATLQHIRTIYSTDGFK